ncbi:MAG: DUF4369 domain-containing protein [Prevotellaceae bacterium]|jgi:hypothetical protein|nr:DUF4369 domain-containing protein [Prevotellaceae bacterium]
MNVKSVSTILFTLLLVSCTHGYHIEGTSSIPDFDGKRVSLKTLRNGQWSTVDSTDVLHGCFAMKGKVDSVMLVMLYLNEEGIMPLVLENGKITVLIDQTQITATGTPLNNALTGFIQKQNDYELRMEELERKEARLIMNGEGSYDEIHESVSRESHALLKERNDHVQRFITANYENVLGPGVFVMMCSTLSYPMMTPQLESIVKAAPLSFKESPLVKDYLGKAYENMRLIEEHQRLRESVATRN